MRIRPFSTDVSPGLAKALFALHTSLARNVMSSTSRSIPLAFPKFSSSLSTSLSTRVVNSGACRSQI